MPDRWVAIQRNPTSGAGPQRRRILEFLRHLRRLGLKVRMFTDRELLRTSLDRPQRRLDLVCVVAAGGDGTVRDMINRIPDVPLAILPLGTENLLARHLGIPRNPRQVAELIAAGHTRRLDVGVIGGRRFVLMASCGFDADVVHRTDARRTGHITKWNYLQPILVALRRYQYPELRVRTDGDPTPIKGRLAVVANLPAYAMRMQIARTASGEDGRLDLRLFERGSAFQTARYLYKVALGRHEQLDDVKALRTTRLWIESDRPVPIQADGDPAGWTPAEVSILPDGLEVFVPDRKP